MECHRVIANLADGGWYKPMAKQQSGDDSPVTGDPTPRTRGSERQGRRVRTS